MPAPTVVALSGNPRPGSRTLGVAHALARRIARELGSPTVPDAVDLSSFAVELLAPEHPTADAALDRVAAADVVVVASPVHKAAYTGLLKAFLDLYGPEGLAGVVAVPLVVAASAAHTLAAEVHLRPVLVELGAVVPTRAVAVVEAELGDLDRVLDRWWAGGGPALRRAVPAGAAAPVAAAAPRVTAVEAVAR